MQIILMNIQQPGQFVNEIKKANLHAFQCG